MDQVPVKLKSTKLGGLLSILTYEKVSKNILHTCPSPSSTTGTTHQNFQGKKPLRDSWPWLMLLKDGLKPLLFVLPVPKSVRLSASDHKSLFICRSNSTFPLNAVNSVWVCVKWNRRHERLPELFTVELSRK